METRAFVEFWAGDREEYEANVAAYERTTRECKKLAPSYGFSSTTPDELTEDEQALLVDLCKSEKSFNTEPRVNPPDSLSIGRITIRLFSEKTPKTCANFIALCTGAKGMSKLAKNKPLHYKSSPVHRIVKDYIAQGGDITRGDGSGGDSIYGGKFNDEKEGLKIAPKFGSLAMANSGKNSNTSQFFIVLAKDQAMLAKLAGKYVVFGKVEDGGDSEAESVLNRLNELGTESGATTAPVVIADCGSL